jgi:hypothetical protein
MKPINPEIEQITKEVSSCVQKICSELDGYKLNPSAEPRKGVIYIAFHLGREYFLTARDGLEQKHVVGSGNVIRASFENLADVSYIFKTQQRTEKYAKQYILSLEVYRQAMLGLHGIDINEVFADRKARQVNKWAGNASIDDRLNDLSKSLVTVYDMFSYFSHPNPAAIAFMGIPGLRDGQLGISQQVNCHIAVMLMAMCVNRGDIQSVTYDELNGLAKRLGTAIVPE